MERKFKFTEGEFYHIYNRGVDKRTIFHNRADYQRFLGLLYLANNMEVAHISNLPNTRLETILSLDRIGTIVDIGAYCLMPNHIHLLIYEQKDSGISMFMKKVMTGYSMYYNKKYDRSGTLFQGRFKAKHIDKDDYLYYLFAYLSLNPLDLMNKEWKETGVKNKEQAKDFLLNYLYSSYSHHSGQPRPEQEKIINAKAFPEYFEKGADFDDLIEDVTKDRP